MRFKGVNIQIIKGNLLETYFEAIVNPADTNLSMKGGLALIIKEKGGFSIYRQAKKIAPIKTGEAIITRAGNLKAKYVIHAATVDSQIKTNERIIRKAMYNILLKAHELKIESLGIPALGCGAGKFPIEASAKIMAQEVFKFVHFNENVSLKKIGFVLITKEAFKIFRKIIPSYINYIYHKIQKGPFLTVDGIIEIDKKILLIERKNPPLGWALPGGFVDVGESIETAVKREVEEETNIKTKSLKFFKVYSEPNRDPRFHTVSCVFIIEPENKDFLASSDAKNAKLFSKKEIEKLKIAFDHKKILKDYFSEYQK